MLIQAKDLFTHALKNNYMAGAFNVFNFDSLMAVLVAANDEQSPVIVQISTGARKYAADFPLFLDCVKRAIDASPVPVLLQHDHCPSIDACREAVEWGFPAIMFDGSHLPFHENVKRTKEVADFAHERGVWVEAELGSLPGFEDEVFSEKNQYTNAAEAIRFVEESGCDALAVAVGTSHGGVLSEGSLPLAFDRLEEIHKCLPGFPLVLHGGASLEKELIDGINKLGAKVPYLRNVSEKDISACARYGICKVNMDVDNFMAFTAAVLQSLRDNPDKYDPRIYLRHGREAFTEQVKHKMKQVLSSSGKADTTGGRVIL